jgi:hypothetical protein
MNARRLSRLVFAWAALFALPNVAWALGATALRHTIARDPDEALGWGAEPWALAFAAAAKLCVGVFAIVAASSHRRLPAYLLLLIGVALLLYGAASALQHALMLTGAVETPEAIGRTAVRWHLLLWDPVWMLGGVLVALTGWKSRRESR